MLVPTLCRPEPLPTHQIDTPSSSSHSTTLWCYTQCFSQSPLFQVLSCPPKHIQCLPYPCHIVPTVFIWFHWDGLQNLIHPLYVLDLCNSDVNKQHVGGHKMNFDVLIDQSGALCPKHLLLCMVLYAPPCHDFCLGAHY